MPWQTRTRATHDSTSALCLSPNVCLLRANLPRLCSPLRPSPDPTTCDPCTSVSSTCACTCTCKRLLPCMHAPTLFERRPIHPPHSSVLHLCRSKPDSCHFRHKPTSARLLQAFCIISCDAHGPLWTSLLCRMSSPLSPLGARVLFQFLRLRPAGHRTRAFFCCVCSPFFPAPHPELPPSKAGTPPTRAAGLSPARIHLGAPTQTPAVHVCLTSTACLSGRALFGVCSVPPAASARLMRRAWQSGSDLPPCEAIRGNTLNRREPGRSPLRLPHGVQVRSSTRTACRRHRERPLLHWPALRKGC